MFSWYDIRRTTRGSGYKPLIIAHRGASGSAPENTLAAFRKAIRAGADAIECDVRLTKDKQIVVIHDATLRRTSNGSGYVSDHTVEQLRSLDAGTWFHRSFAGERIPLLKEVLELVDAKVGLNVEIKPVSDNALARDTVLGCLATIQQYRAHEYVLLTSFQHALLKLIRHHDRSALLGLLYHPVHHLVSHSTLARRFDARVWVCAVRFLRRAMVEKAHRHNIPLAAYTVNNRYSFQRCFDLGIEGLVTDVPETMRKFVDTDR